MDVDEPEQCVVTTSPETGETYRVRLATDEPLSDDDRRDLAIYMDHIAAAARRRYEAESRET